ncbi:MAG: putative toxin-antitoxin system toxin component, PIN family [Burkholderiales bacterium]|nr:putative toxin-antitoxin system toxin component, PIN family [Burkholderiales bacterium]
MKAAVIVDTNVVVAGFPIAGNALPVAAILRDMLSGELAFAASEPLLAEYREVLSRPPLQKLHGLADDALRDLVARLEQKAHLVEPAAAALAPDPGDQMLWELLAAHPDLVLVTCDKLLLRDRAMRGRVITPQAWLALA